MIENNKRFKVKKFLFETKSGEVILRHMLTDNLLPMLVPNQYVEMMSINKLGTGRNHANKLCVFFNYLHDHHMANYESASNEQVQKFVTYLIYGDLADLRITDPVDSKCYSTLSGYVSTITNFYKWCSWTTYLAKKLNIFGKNSEVILKLKFPVYCPTVRHYIPSKLKSILVIPNYQFPIYFANPMP